jgi:hypothetical protein
VLDHLLIYTWRLIAGMVSIVATGTVHVCDHGMGSSEEIVPYPCHLCLDQMNIVGLCDPHTHPYFHLDYTLLHIPENVLE